MSTKYIMATEWNVSAEDVSVWFMIGEEKLWCEALVWESGGLKTSVTIVYTLPDGKDLYK